MNEPLLIFLYASLSFIIGIAAGFQGIYERYLVDSVRASITIPGTFYLISRGAIPAAVFALTFDSFRNNLLLYALACGAGIEVVLRSSFYVKKTSEISDINETGDLLRGPLDLLRWYQGLFLSSIASSLAGSRKQLVNKHLPNSNYLDLNNTVLSNILAWPEPSMRKELADMVDRLRQEFEKDSKIAADDEVELQKRHKLALCYLVLNKTGRKGFKILLGA